MRFNYIKLREAGDERTIMFSEKNNLIFSKENSKGKTTLLRLLLYSLGYNIPNTKNIRFEDCIVESLVTIGNGVTLRLYRDARSYIVVDDGEKSTTYALPGQEREFQTLLFGAENVDLLRNILGVFYYDQEMGWVLLNRGTVIGGYYFNIEELIRGINDIDCTELIAKRKKLNQDLAKYKQMFSVSKYKETLDTQSKDLATESFDSVIESKINQCRIRLSMLKKEMARIDAVKNENEGVRKYITEMGILVKMPNGENVILTADNIVGLNDTIEYLKAKKKIIAVEYNQVKSELDGLSQKRVKENQQLSFFEDTETITEIFDNRISNIPIDSARVEKRIKSIQEEIADINTRIRQLTRHEKNGTISAIYNTAKMYLNELKLDGDKISEKYLFTSNTKGLSGAILHKTVFALRLACLVEVQKRLGFHLPIILDSPRGKEIDPQNINMMLDILKRDFTDNQIIIASIYKYDLNNINEIEIQNRLIE